MRLRGDPANMRLWFEPLTFYQKFEQICVLIRA
jgi:hypothetical protein